MDDNQSGGRFSRASIQAVWAQHKATITDLYVAQDKTLKEVMQVMSDEHNFEASTKAYKSHFQKWNLQKNLRYSEVEKLLSRGEGRAVENKRLHSYIRRLPANRRKGLTNNFEGIEQQQQPWNQYPSRRSSLTPSSSGSSGDSLSPLSDYSSPSPAPYLAMPDGLQHQSQCIWNTRGYIARSSDATREYVGKRTFVLPSWVAMDWQQAVIAVRSLFEKGHTHEAFQILQRSSKDLVQITKDDDPVSLFYVFVVLVFLNADHPEISQAILRYVYQLAVTYRSPYAYVLQSLIGMNSLGNPTVAKAFTDVFIKLFREHLGEDAFLAAELEAMIARQLAAVGLETLEAAMAVHRQTYAVMKGHQDQLPPESESHPSHTVVSMGWLYYRFKRYDDARAVLDGLLKTEDIDKYPHAHEACFKYAFLMDSEGDDTQRAVASGRRWVEYYRTWSAEPDRVTDALSQYSSYLRRVGLSNEADQLHDEFEKRIEEVREGVEDLTIVEEKYRRDSEQGGKSYPTPSPSRADSIDAKSPVGTRELDPTGESDVWSANETDVKCEPVP